MASFWIKNRVWNKADDFATSSLLYERCNNSSARPMRKGPDFSLLYEWCNNFRGRVMRKSRDFSLLYERCNIFLARPMRNYGLWNRNALMECLGNEKGVRIFTELLRRLYSFILRKWWDIVDILQQSFFYWPIVRTRVWAPWFRKDEIGASVYLQAGRGIGRVPTGYRTPLCIV